MIDVFCSQLINRVLSGHSWGNGQLCAVVLLKELKSALVDVLKNHFFSSDLVFPKVPNISSYRVLFEIICVYRTKSVSS